jgi:hypothetical protein
MTRRRRCTMDAAKTLTLRQADLLRLLQTSTPAVRAP